MNNDTNSSEEVLQITPEQLAQGWYWGEIKRQGTPDSWILALKGTRSARWIDPALLKLDLNQ